MVMAFLTAGTSSGAGCRLVTAASSSRGPRPAKRSNLSPGNRGCQGHRPREAGLLREEPAALGACLVQHLAHGQALGPGDAPYLVELGRHRDHAAVQARDLE